MAFRGRGRGAGPRGALKGATWEFDPTLELENKPTADFPPHPSLPTAPPPTPLELSQVSEYMILRQKIHSGPLYTYSSKKLSDDPTASAMVFNEEQINDQYAGRNSKAAFDPFNGMQMWSERYVPKRRYLPEIKGTCWDARFFPPELQSLLPGHNTSSGRSSSTKHLTPAERAKRLQDNFKRAIGDADGVEGEEDKEENEEGKEDEDRERNPDSEEDVDDDFEDADDDMGGDYNAENYFDNGEADDDGDDEDGGGDDY